MYKKIFIFILSAILIVNTILSKNVHAEDGNNVIRVGLFQLEPYSYLNSKGEVDGYYVELFNLIAKKMNVDVEYVLCDMEEWIPSLENMEVDIILGASITEDRIEKFLFNKHSIALENFALYTNNDAIDYSNFKNLSGLRFGYVAENAKSEWTFNFFKALNIDIIPVKGRDYSELKEFMDEDKIDLMIDSANSKNDYKKVYEFLGDQAYIAANKDEQELLNLIDIVIAEYKDNGVVDDIYKSYFDDTKIDIKIKLLIIGISIILIVFFASYFIPNLNKRYKRSKINKRLKRDRYLLHYQPIYDPINEVIVGFEALLRFKDKNNNLIPPIKFIPEIENNNMLFDVTIWILSKVILDYKSIKNYKCTNKNKFYISINLSIDEIRNNEFVDKAIRILNESKLENESICLEIVERVAMKDLDKIVNNIARLKNAGFKIAIDDFGSEYSNLDVLEKLDADIIKVDKKFVDGLGKHLIKYETVLFILRVAKKDRKFVVLEGVEEKEQDNIIKSFNMNNVFVQGYFYNKPMEIKNIKAL